MMEEAPVNWVDDNLQTTLGVLGDLSLVVLDERHRRGLSLGDVEAESGVVKSYIWAIERGDANPTREVIEAILQWALQSRQIEKPEPITPQRNRGLGKTTRR